jgi:ABC-type lipoprotein release transport system permease subunit
MPTLLQEFIYAGRQLLKSPGYAQRAREFCASSFKQGLVLVVAGLVLGVVCALWAGRLVKSFLYEVKPLDGWTYASVVGILLLVGILAALIPARRAAAVEPIEALRDE